MMRFQHLLPAFIGFFIVGMIIGLLVDGIGLGLVLGVVVGLIATAIFWQISQGEAFPQASGLGPPASIPTRASGSSTTIEDIIETEEAKKRTKSVNQPSRGLKPHQPVQDLERRKQDTAPDSPDFFGESEREPSTRRDRDGNEPSEPEEIEFLDAKSEEELGEAADDDFDAILTQELGVSQQGRVRSTTDNRTEPDPDSTSNRLPDSPLTGTQAPPPPPIVDPEPASEEDEATDILWLKELADKQPEGRATSGETSDRVIGGDYTGGQPPMQPQPVAPPRPPSKPEPEPALDIEKENAIDEEWVPAEEVAEEEPSKPKPREEKPAVAAENVQFTLYHPKDAAAEHWYSLLTYIHVESAIQAVQDDAKKFTTELTHDHREVRSRKTAKLTRGTEIRLVPHADGLEFNPSLLTIAWVEDFHRADFRFRASQDVIGEPVLGELTVYVGPLEIANLRFSIFVTETPTTVTDTSPETNSVQGEMYKRIFASYSHSDTPIVKACVAAFKAIGYDVLIDYETLRSGEDWSEALERLIDESDIFQLFWSTNAAKSKFVQQEWEYALKRRANEPNLKAGEGFIRPVYWEQPTPNIPESLAHIHFKYLADLATLDK